MGSLWTPIPLYKCQASSSPRYTENPLLSHYRVLGDLSFSDLTFRGSLASTSPVLFVGSWFLVVQVPIGAFKNNHLIDDFWASSVGAVCREWVISHITASKTKNCMVQMWSTTTINQETGNPPPPNALERQMQTLAAVVERLTQCN